MKALEEIKYLQPSFAPSPGSLEDLDKKYRVVARVAFGFSHLTEATAGELNGLGYWREEDVCWH
mgnify:CR=1 FL=1